MGTRHPSSVGTRPHWPLILLLLALLLGHWASARAEHAPLLTLSGAQAPVRLNGAAQAWLDRDGRVTADWVSSPDVDLAWGILPADGRFDLSAGQALWVRFSLPVVPMGENWYLDLPYAPVDRITLYTRGETGDWLQSTAGDRVPVSERPNSHPHPLMPLAVSRVGKVDYLLRIESPHTFAAPLQLVRTDMLVERSNRQSLVLGGMFGLLTLGLGLTAMLALGRRDPVLELFALMQLMAAVAAASLTGVAGVYMWPESPDWNDLSPTLFSYALFASTTLAIVTALQSVPGLRRLQRLMQVVAGFGLVMVCLSAWVEPSLRIKAVGAYALLSTLLSTLTCVAAASRGAPSAAPLAWTLLPLLVATALPVARASGVSMPLWASQYGFLVGLTLHSPALLLVWLRYQSRRSASQSRLETIDRVDPATGLGTRAVFVERGTEMIRRSTQFRHQGVVLLLDIANAERIERDYSDFAPDELPVRVAERLSRVAREVDVVTRLSERRFGMVVEGPVSPTGEAAIGPRLVAACLMPFPDKPQGWVAQVRVAYALAPLDGSDMEVLILRLSALLDSIPTESRKAVFTLGSGSVLSEGETK